MIIQRSLTWDKNLFEMPSWYEQNWKEIRLSLSITTLIWMKKLRFLILMSFWSLCNQDNISLKCKRSFPWNCRGFTQLVRPSLSLMMLLNSVSIFRELLFCNSAYRLTTAFKDFKSFFRPPRSFDWWCCQLVRSIMNFTDFWNTSLTFFVTGKTSTPTFWRRVK